MKYKEIRPKKRVVHRNHIVQYFPKEREIQPLLPNILLYMLNPNNSIITITGFT